MRESKTTKAKDGERPLALDAGGSPTKADDAPHASKDGDGTSPDAGAGPKGAPTSRAPVSGEPAAKSHRNIGLIVAGVVVIIVLAFVFMRGEQLQEFLDAIKKGSPLFLVLAVVAQLGKYLSQGFGFKACFNAVGGKIGFKTGITLVFGTFFVNTIAPSLNLAGTSLVVDTARKQGIAAGKGTSAAFLMQLCIDTGFVMIMLISFGVLSFTVGLQIGWFLLGLVAIALVGGLAGVMILGGTHPELVLKVLRPIERLIDKILRKLKKKPIDAWAEKTVDAFSASSKEIVRSPKRTLKAFGFSLIASACEVSCFVLVGVSFGIHDVEPLVCGYVLATLFAMVSIVPQGVGVVEAAVMVGFGLFGVNTAAGMATVMVYRSIVFWLPFLIGAIVIQRMGFRRDRKKAQGAASSEQLPAANGSADAARDSKNR